MIDPLDSGLICIKLIYTKFKHVRMSLTLGHGSQSLKVYQRIKKKKFFLFVLNFCTIEQFTNETIKFIFFI